MDIGVLTVGTVWVDVPNSINIYIGRGTNKGSTSVLCNPLFISTANSRDKCCDYYIEHLALKMKSDTPERKEMERIAGILLEGKNVNLQCFCKGNGFADRRCHGDTIKLTIDKAIEPMRSK